MENTDNNRMMQRSGKVWAGMFIIVIGGLLLLENVGLNMPDWIFSWHTFLMALGLFIGFRHRFRDSGWLILFFIGSFFTLREILPDVNMSKTVFPVMLVLLGIFLIFKPKNRRPCFGQRRRLRDRIAFGTYPETSSVPDDEQENRNNYLDSVNVFGGSHQAVYSKNFKGGDIVAVFGGCDVNLTQADFEGEIRIEIVAIFGGAKIIVPTGWEIKSEITAILGGMDDKRAIQPMVEGAPRKLLVITGLALFGGIDIRNY